MRDTRPFGRWRAWPCRRPSPGRRASSRSRRSRRPGTRRSRARGRSCPRPSDRRARAAVAGTCRPPSDGHGLRRRHQRSRQMVRRRRHDPGVRERTRAPARRGDARSGWSACEPGSTVLASPRPRRAPRTCLRPGRATVRARSAAAARPAGRNAPARPPWGSGRRTSRPACRAAASTGTCTRCRTARARPRRASAAKSSSVSPGNPTMMSVDTAISGMAMRIASSHPR